ncbi:hypothetical protein ACFV2U_35555, partial [Streptomyces sp. NPDC059697]
MTETTQTQMKPPGGAKPRSPEFRLAADALRGLRQDLFHDAFAYRPLPRMRVDGPLTRRLPEGVREYAAWTPHAVITAGGRGRVGGAGPPHPCGPRRAAGGR